MLSRVFIRSVRSRRRGVDESPVHRSEVIIRVIPSWRLNKDYEETGKLAPKLFELSSGDKTGKRPHLSVYVERVTPHVTACNLLTKIPERAVIARLCVEDVQALRPEPELDTVESLQVTWEPAVLADGTPDVRPGAEGHAGILGLKRPKDEPKGHRQSYSEQLAGLCSCRFAVAEVTL